MFSRWKKNDAPIVAPSDGLSVNVGACTDTGQVRSENQDCYGVVPEEHPRLFVVCDGMGGHADGARASRLAVNALLNSDYLNGIATEDGLRQAISRANQAVRSESNAADGARRMGTTCTALAISPDRMVLGHVGDSRAYRIGETSLEQISEDHTVAAEMQASGMLSAVEADRHPRGRALTRALGMDDDVEVFTSDLGLPRPGQRFLLCSDGLALADEHEIWRAASAYDPQEAAEWLVARANALGGPDNITVIIVELAAG